MYCRGVISSEKKTEKSLWDINMKMFPTTFINPVAIQFLTKYISHKYTIRYLILVKVFDKNTATTSQEGFQGQQDVETPPLLQL